MPRGHAGRREARGRPDRERQARALDFQPGDQGRDRPRREHHGRPDARDPRRRGDRQAREHDARGLYARRDDQPRPGHHHRRHQIRVRPGPRRQNHPDRRGDDPRQFALLGGGQLPPGRPQPSFDKQPLRDSRCRAPRRSIERRRAGAYAAGRSGGGHSKRYLEPIAA